MLIIIHELGHCFGCILFNKKINKITIYPLGGCTEYEDLLNSSILKELLILLMGPIFQIAFCILIFFLYKMGYVYIETYNSIIYFNKLLLIFNFLPIIPLDGSKLLKLILNKLFSFKKSLIINIYISCAFMILMLILKHDLFFILITILLVKSVIKEIKYIKKTFNKFLLERYLYYFDYKISKNITKIDDLKRCKKHNIKYNNKILSEREYLTIFFDKL